jgi:hypothetical protein
MGGDVVGALIGGDDKIDTGRYAVRGDTLAEANVKLGCKPARPVLHFRVKKVPHG